MTNLTSLRVDKWLWAARFYKTRSLAQAEVEKGRVRIGGQDLKPAREVKPGDVLEITVNSIPREVVVKAVSNIRGGAPQAQLLYEETPASLLKREQAATARKLAPEPGQDVKGRPTKRERRDIESIKLKFAGERFDW
jgi:ribosome-associated heat shock protein Hsp15